MVVVQRARRYPRERGMRHVPALLHGGQLRAARQRVWTVGRPIRPPALSADGAVRAVAGAVTPPTRRVRAVGQGQHLLQLRGRDAPCQYGTETNL